MEGEKRKKKQLNTHTCCIYGLHKRKRIYRVGTEREWVRRYVWGYRWQILLDGRFKTTKLIVGRKIFDLYKCSSVYIFIIKKKKKDDDGLRGRKWRTMGKKNVNRPTMLVAMKDNKGTWGWIQCACVCLCKRIQRRNMIVWMSKVESWKRSIKRSIVRCNKLLEKRYTIIEERRIVSNYISLCIYTHI